MSTRHVGAAVRRREDPRLLTGRSLFVDDVAAADCLYAVVARSTHAHARLARVDLTGARRHPAVVGCFAFADLQHVLVPLPTAGAPPPPLEARVGLRLRTAAQFPLAAYRVRYTGEPVAVLVAETRASAEDAAALVDVTYEPLPVVADVARGLEDGAPLLHPEWDDNVAVSFHLRIGDPDTAFAEAPVRIRETLRVPRSAGMPLEPRAVLAMPDRRAGTMTVWASTQVPHFLQEALVAALRVPAHKIRVVAPDVGGGFGTKASVYPEDILIPILAARFGRPVRWTETRREHMQSATHSREQVHEIEMAAHADGTIAGLRDRLLLDQGAYIPWGIVQPYNTVAHLPGPYRIRHAAFDVRCVVTNKTPHAPYRGAGRTEAVFVMERMLDLLARRLGMDPADLRRRNTIQADELPYDAGFLYRDGNPCVYDSGNFAAALEHALDRAGYDVFRREQVESRRRGVYRGAGIAAYVEGTGLGPFESAAVRLDTSGKVVVATGACSQGQGHETTLAQIAADALDAGLDDVTVVGGDTRELAAGVGTYASRSVVVAGNAVAGAAQDVRRKVIRAAAALLEAAEPDLEIETGRVFVRGAPARGLTLAEIVRSSLPTLQGAPVADAVFEAVRYETVPTVTFASAVHVVLVDVDPEIGAVTILRYVVAHDCGRIINPLIVEGQIHGGVAQGIGGALAEFLAYDEEGQLLSGSFADYALPKAREIPHIETIHLEYPSPRNPLAVKGVGEGGAIAPPAALANAVEDALAPFGVRITEGPVTPARIVALLRAGTHTTQNTGQRGIDT